MHFLLIGCHFLLDAGVLLFQAIRNGKKKKKKKVKYSLEFYLKYLYGHFSVL